VEFTKPVINAWRRLIEDLNPDLILFDHCPSGLLASRGMKPKRVLIGTGFTCPRAVSPFPNWRAEAAHRGAELRKDEQDVLTVVNEIARCVGSPPLQTLADLYSQVDAEILTTYPELDHFGVRPNATYDGAWPLEWGDEPRWPSATGKKVFAYLKDSPELQTVVSVLQSLPLCALVYRPNAPDSLLPNPDGSNVRVVRHPIRMSAAVAGCDFAILNGTHTTTIQMLRGGRPVISLPIFLEQQLTGAMVEQMSAGICLPRPAPGVLKQAIERMVAGEDYHQAARHFAEKYATDSAPQAITNICNRLQSLL
jgi:hypothetical protein